MAKKKKEDKKYKGPSTKKSGMKASRRGRLRNLAGRGGSYSKFGDYDPKDVVDMNPLKYTHRGRNYEFDQYETTLNSYAGKIRYNYNDGLGLGQPFRYRGKLFKTIANPGGGPGGTTGEEIKV